MDDPEHDQVGEVASQGADAGVRTGGQFACAGHLQIVQMLKYRKANGIGEHRQPASMHCSVPPPSHPGTDDSKRMTGVTLYSNGSGIGRR